MVRAEEVKTVLDDAGLSSEETQLVAKLMKEPTALDIVESLRVVSLLQTSFRASTGINEKQV